MSMKIMNTLAFSMEGVFCKQRSFRIACPIKNICLNNQNQVYMYRNT
jgi:hypothetical protein